MHPGIINNGHGGKITIKSAAVRLIYCFETSNISRQFKTLIAGDEKLRRLQLLQGKRHFEIGYVFCHYFTFVTYEMGEEYFHEIGTKDFHAKAENERFTTAGSRCRQNLKFDYFTLGRLTTSQVRAARAKRLFFLFQSIISLIKGVAIVVTVVVS